MRALSVYPEWAKRICSGEKTLEIRSRRTHHRGELLICATKPEGCTVCIVQVVGCRPFMPQDSAAACIPWAPNLWAWELSSAIPVERRAIRGRQGMFHLDWSPAGS